MHLRTVKDFTDEEVDWILRGTATPYDARRPTTVGLRFESPSLRTHVGFGVATTRIGGVAIDVPPPRFDESMSDPEDWLDSVRTVCGMVDVLVVRTPRDLGEVDPEWFGSAQLVNAGDRFHHPTQALVDVHAIETALGEVPSLRIGLVGDLTMRAATSLLELLDRRGVTEVVAIAPPARRDVSAARRGPTIVHRDPGDFAGLDAIVMLGLPPRRGDDELDEAARRPYAMTATELPSVEPGAGIFSPMPIIDEIDGAVRSDPRLRMWDQSDRSVDVRARILSVVLARPA